ncbi:hypothetical protein THAOC_11550, partial [Thalassiosira oceanica]
MRPLFGRELGLLPYVVAWLERFAKSCPDLKLSSIYEFVQVMPIKATGRGLAALARVEQRLAPVHEPYRTSDGAAGSVPYSESVPPPGVEA